MAGGGARALRRVDSSPRSPRPLSKNDSIKKRSKESSRRRWLGARLSAVLHELRLAPRAREESRLVHVTGHRGGGTAAEAVASTDDFERARLGPGASRLGRGTSAAVGDGPFGTPNGLGIGGGRRCASWALAAALVIVLACVVALGKVPAICCCTCAAWLCGGGGGGGRAEEHRYGSACRRRIGIATLGTRVQPQAGSGSTVVMRSVPGGTVDE